MKKWVIYGNSLSALVLAERLGSIGYKIDLLNPSKNWGGIFSGIHFNKTIFDSGMTNFEFDLFGEKFFDIENYNPDNHRDINKYVHSVKNYISNFIKLRTIETPQIYFEQKKYPDLLITNKFDVLQSLPPHIKLSIINELNKILLNVNNLHAKFKNDPNSHISNATFEEVSIANHGLTFHKLFIEPFFRKVLAISTSQIPGPFHRSGWAPLFYPETLFSQFSSNPQILKPTLFHYPEKENFGVFIKKILHQIKKYKSINLHYDVKDIIICKNSNTISSNLGNFSFEKLAWGGEIEKIIFKNVKLNKKLNVYDKASLDLFFIEVDASDIKNHFSVIMDLNLTSLFYRATNQTVCSGSASKVNKIIFESNTINSNNKEITENINFNSSIISYGINPMAIKNLYHRTFHRALKIPTKNELLEFNALRDEIRFTMPSLELIGPSSGYISTTLNDQVIQSLKIAKKEGVLI